MELIVTKENYDLQFDYLSISFFSSHYNSTQFIINNNFFLQLLNK